jgi:hypothetical protein
MPRPAEIEVEEWPAPKSGHTRFRALGEAGKPAFLPQRADAVAASCQDLVRIALVANVEDQPVMRGFEHLVDGNRQFDHAETGSQMPAGARHRVDHLGTQFLCKLRQQLVVDGLQVGWEPDGVQEWCYGRVCHVMPHSLSGRSPEKLMCKPGLTSEIRSGRTCHSLVCRPFLERRL